MCELFAMSAREAATVALSFAEFSQRGGGTGHHADGWGVAFYDGRDARLLREPAPASSSACVRLLQAAPPRSERVVSHIRRATRGGVTLANTQPFARELGGRVHVFAHNGDLPRVQRELALGAAAPIGETDSEHAFCALLARLECLWREGANTPALANRLAVLGEFARRLRALGPANFLYADGETLFAHADRRLQPSGGIEPPGLHLLERACAHEPSLGPGIEIGASGQEVVLVASVPLSGEAWKPLERGTLAAVEHGRIAALVASS